MTTTFDYIIADIRLRSNTDLVALGLRGFKPFYDAENGDTEAECSLAIDTEFNLSAISIEHSISTTHLAEAAPNKASLVFRLPHDEGSLAKVLSIMSYYDMNLTKIQSMPIIGREWEYEFYVDLRFEDYLKYKQSIEAFQPLTKDLVILGEYREGRQTI